MEAVRENRTDVDDSRIDSSAEDRVSRKKSRSRERKRRNSRSSSAGSSSPSSRKSRSRSKKKKKKRRKDDEDGSKERSRSRSSSKKSKKSKKDKKKKKLKKLKKKELKELKRLVKLRNKEFKAEKEDRDEPVKNGDKKSEVAVNGPDLTSSKKSPKGNVAKIMKPMTKEEWEAKQSVIRRVYDPITGRNRLVKGDGEILEECVSRDRHVEINRRATASDGEYFQKILSSQLSS